MGPYSDDFGGEVVNFAINRYVRVTGNPGSETGDFESNFEIPRGSGLGTSSAMNVAMAAIMSCGEDKPPEELADIQDSVWVDYAKGNPSVIEGLHKIRAAARPMANGLQQDRRNLVVQSFKDVCEGVDMIDTSLHDPFREVVEPLLESGSIAAWKALGAGGGGCAALLCSPSGRDDTIASVEGAGWELIEWDYDGEGVRIAH